MPAYPIGQLAATIITVNIANTGVILPSVLYRSKTGAPKEDRSKIVKTQKFENSVEFVFEVNPGNWGSVTYGGGIWDDPYGYTTHMLGLSTPFDDDQGEVRARLLNRASNGGVGVATQIAFTATKDKVTWAYEEFSGSFPIGKSYPEIAIAFRLPKNNQGLLTFTSGVSFTQAFPSPGTKPQTGITEFPIV